MINVINSVCILPGVVELGVTVVGKLVPMDKKLLQICGKDVKRIIYKSITSMG